MVFQDKYYNTVFIEDFYQIHETLLKKFALLANKILLVKL